MISYPKIGQVQAMLQPLQLKATRLYAACPFLHAHPVSGPNPEDMLTLIPGDQRIRGGRWTPKLFPGIPPRMVNLTISVLKPLSRFPSCPNGSSKLSLPPMKILVPKLSEFASMNSENVNPPFSHGNVLPLVYRAVQEPQQLQYAESTCLANMR
ncbi:hypothetical protein ACHAWU_001475 [Discostella pseudostelligera]|uniref:Uncharacterized protein n=1 Tax=Discostella pseudostelligera TaxID=259834 RepID=A0ABD3MM48_9STRA